VSYNYAQGNGGGIFNGEFGVISIENSKIIRNFSIDTGGEIRNSSEGIIMIADSEINWNSSVIDGGGISVGAGTEIYIYNSHINYNTCFSEGEDGGGGFHGGASSKATIHNSTISWNSSPGLGGGFDIGAGHDLTLTNSTVSGNVAGDGGGGIFADAGGYIRMTNATISANRALTDTLSYRAGGGAIALVGGADMDIQYSTIVSNTTPSLEVRNGIYITDSAALTMSNSIVANHIDDCQNFNTFTDAGYNLVEDGSCITETTSLSGDPLLGTLQDNGGDTETHALQVGSNALDHIPIGVNGCGTDVREDQRGYLRPGFLGCDIGSYERTFVKAIYQPIVFKE
jgi:hypothetical protein